MINIAEINKEIAKLENSNKTTMSICQQLAILYVVRDHLMNKPKMVNELTKE